MLKFDRHQHIIPDGSAVRIGQDLANVKAAYEKRSHHRGSVADGALRAGDGVVCTRSHPVLDVGLL